MSTSQIKEQLHNYIDLVDEHFLRSLHAMMQNYVQEEESILGYTVDGKPLTKKSMINVLNEAVSDVENDKGISSDDIRNAKKSW